MARHQAHRRAGDSLSTLWEQAVQELLDDKRQSAKAWLRSNKKEESNNRISRFHRFRRAISRSRARMFRDGARANVMNLCKSRFVAPRHAV
jgi:hypothetical protein